MSRVLITGCDGFVGRTLTARMNDAGYEVWGVDRVPDDGTFAGHTHLVNNLSDAGEVGALVVKAEPDAIVHLAAQASVRQSFDEPRETLVSNTVPVLNLLEALRSGKPGIRLLAIGSAEEYGKVAPEALPPALFTRWMKRFGVLPESFDPAEDALDPYETDRAYWRSLWHRPPVGGAGRADANCDGNIDISDVIFMVKYVFEGGIDPCY